MSRFDFSLGAEVLDLYINVFSASEGPEEGESIGLLVRNLLATTPPGDLTGYVAIDNKRIVGCIFFSRFYNDTVKSAFILSPVAVATDVQKTGVGQRLINYGLEQFRSLNISLILTYGDPDYYVKCGFQPVSESLIPAPLPLSYPHGWLAISLQHEPIPHIQGPTRCVEALSDPKFW